MSKELPISSDSLIKGLSLHWVRAVQRIAMLLFVAFAYGARAEAAASESPADLTDIPIEKLMEMEIKTVYGASKYVQKTTEAPSSISVVSADEIKRFGHRTLADVLESLQGFSVSYDRNYSFLGTRGINLGDFNSR